MSLSKSLESFAPTFQHASDTRGEMLCPQCHSWLEHWRKKTGILNPPCSAWDCKEKDVIGVCVKKVKPTEKGLFIIPLCKKHSHPADDVDMKCKYGTLFVSSKMQPTCD